MSRDDADWLVELEGSARRILEILGDRDVAAMIAIPEVIWRTCRQDVAALVRVIDRLRRDGRWSDAP